MLYWSLHCSPASARYLWNASFSVTWHHFWRRMLKLLLTNSRISYIGLFWILRQRGLVALGENKELQVFLPSMVIQISFLFLFSISWLCLWALISRPLMENCRVKHNLYCSSFFFPFPPKNNFWGRFWGMFLEVFGFQYSKAPEILLCFASKKTQVSPTEKWGTEQLTSAAFTNFSKILSGLLTNLFLFTPPFYIN